MAHGSLDPYKGKQFITSSVITYSISDKGNLGTRLGFADDGAELELIVGIEPMYYPKAMRLVESKPGRVPNFIKAHGQPVAVGLHMLIELTKRSRLKRGLHYLLTGPVVDIKDWPTNRQGFRHAEGDKPLLYSTYQGR